MSSSVLFSQDNMLTYNNSAPSNRPQHTTQLTHWLTQQQQISSRPLPSAHRIDRIMSNNSGSFHSQHGQRDDLLHSEYTFETQPPHPGDDFNPVWTSPTPTSIYTPETHMQLSIRTNTHQHRAPYDQWNMTSFNNSNVDQTSTSPNYLQGDLSPYAIRPSCLSHPSPTNSPLYSPPSSLPSPSPSTPGSGNQLMHSPIHGEPKDVLSHDSGSSDNLRYTHRQQLLLFRQVLTLEGPGPFLPQTMYKPHTTSDRKRYVEEVLLEAPLYFVTEHPHQNGISLRDALHTRTKRLHNRDQVVFEGRGPSVSIRLEWPGYRQWSRQIPTKDFRSPPQPITLGKLAKNVAKCVHRFIQDRKDMPMEEEADPRWRIGDGHNDIKLDDLILVSIHHVSLGSWQPQLRLARPLPSRTRNVPSQGSNLGHISPPVLPSLVRSPTSSSSNMMGYHPFS